MSTIEHMKGKPGFEFIQEILGGFYKLDRVQAASFEYDKESDEYVIGFDFKPYDKVIHSLDHISGNQIHEGVMEACYLIAGYLIKNGVIEGIELKDLLEMRAVALFRDYKIKFKKEIRIGQQNVLRFQVLEARTIRSFGSKLEICFDGFATGSCTSVISSQDLADRVLQQ